MGERWSSDQQQLNPRINKLQGQQQQHSNNLEMNLKGFLVNRWILLKIIKRFEPIKKSVVIFIIKLGR